MHDDKDNNPMLAISTGWGGTGGTESPAVALDVAATQMYPDNILPNKLPSTEVKNPECKPNMYGYLKRIFNGNCDPTKFPDSGGVRRPL